MQLTSLRGELEQARSEHVQAAEAWSRERSMLNERVQSLAAAEEQHAEMVMKNLMAHLMHTHRHILHQALHQQGRLIASYAGLCLNRPVFASGERGVLCPAGAQGDQR